MVIDVTIKPGDVVIDAGAWIGDFSAYAVTKGAVAYAFEPVQATFQLLSKTAELNGNKIYPVQKGLGSKECKIPIFIDENNTGGNSIHSGNNTLATEIITITTLDKFVEENNIKK
jgi:FkbM family methyltransferase